MTIMTWLRAAALALALAAPAGGAMADCLTDGHKRVVPSIDVHAANAINGSNNTVYDFTSIGPLDEAPPGYPLGITGGNGVCVHGMRVIGKVSADVDWQSMKHNYEGTSYIHKMSPTGSPSTIVENHYAFNTMDGFRPSLTGGLATGATWIVRSSYFRWVRDDMIENDHCLTGTVDDDLFEAGFSGFSQRPDASVGSVCPSGNDNPVTFKDSLIGLYCLSFRTNTTSNSGTNYGDCPVPAQGDPYNTNRTQKGALLGMFKDAAHTGPYILDHVTIYLPHLSRAGSGGMDFPHRAIDHYTNVIVVWTGGGPYPGALPATGVTVTTDKATFWDAPRAAWLAAHGCPDVDRAGCTWKASGPPPPPPDVTSVSATPTTIDWVATEVAHFAGYRVRTSPATGTPWASMTPFAGPPGSPWPNGLDPAKTLDRADLPVGTIKISVKEEDDHGQQSPDEASVTLPCACGCLTASLATLAEADYATVAQAFGCPGRRVPH